MSAGLRDVVTSKGTRSNANSLARQQSIESPKERTVMGAYPNEVFVHRLDSIIGSRIKGARRNLVFAVLGLLSLAACTGADETNATPVSGSRVASSGEGPTILFEDTRKTSRGTYTFVAEVDERGEARLVAYGEHGGAVAWEEAIDFDTAPVIDEGLVSLSEAGASEKVVIALSLRDDIPATKAEPEWGAIDDESGRVWINGREASDEEVLAANRRRQASLEQDRQARVEKRAQVLGELVAREKWAFSTEAIREAAESSDPLRLELDPVDIRRMAEAHSDLIGAIELYQEPEDESLATAMAATWVNPGAHGLGHSGADIGIYMTESGCPPAGYLPNYTRLAGSDTDHSRNVSAITRAVAPGSYLYCRGGPNLPLSSELSNPGPGGMPPILVVTRSNGNTSSSAYGVLDRDWDNFVYANAIPVTKSAGNDGTTTGNISTPGKGLNVITVGNYDDKNRKIVFSSSWLDPTNTKNFKPELVAPGVSINAGRDAAGRTITMTGTSQAAPHVAGIAALLMESSIVRQGRPHLVAASLYRGARDPVGGGFDSVGFGGIDYNHAGQRGWAYYYEGENDSFSHFDSLDPLPDNGTVDLYANLTSQMGLVRIVLTHLTRGTWTYDHRNDTFPIGRALTFSVYRPDGTLVAATSNFYASVQSLEFQPPVSGDYLIRISEHWNNDTIAKLHMAIAMSYEN